MAPPILMHKPPQVVESLPDGGNLWIMLEYAFDTLEDVVSYGCSWDSAYTIAADAKTPVPFVERWFPNPAAARLAWEISKPKRPKLKSRYGTGFVDPKGIFGSSKA